MGFKSVFKSLQEVFPQVDVRILKAAAIEHSKDADAAVEFILFEVLPSISSPQERPCPPIYNWDNHSSISNPLDAPPPSDYQGVEHPSTIGEEQNVLLKYHEAVEEANTNPSSKSRLLESEVYAGTGHTKNAPDISSTHLDETLAGSSVSYFHGGHDPDQLCLNIETEELTSSAKNQEINATFGSYQGPHAQSSSMIHEDTVISGHFSDVPDVNIQDLNCPVAHDSDSSICRENLHDQSCLNVNSLEVETVPPTFLHDTSPVCEGKPESVKCASKNDIDSSVCESEKPDSSGTPENVSEQVIYDAEMLCVEDKSSTTTIITQSGQFCRIDLLEDAIKDAKNNKKTLFSSMESVINMMGEVELKEKVAEEAKEEASRGGLATFSRAEDLRQMVQHAMEANNMHAGEVYGEKSILATEARELQSRLLNLSEERDRSLAILDEMHQTLEARLAAAEEVRKAAELVKLEREESAQRALVEQELIMDKVVQESNRLQQEAEENLNLREFLMDRGRVVDALQGEIAVICQDVKFLKEKFDACIPISKSLSSSQTSCVLASSGSSFKSLALDPGPEQVESSVAPKKMSPTSSIDGGSQKSSPKMKGIGDDRKVLSDDDWDLFDEAELHN